MKTLLSAKVSPERLTQIDELSDRVEKRGRARPNRSEVVRATLAVAYDNDNVKTTIVKRLMDAEI